MNRKEYKKPKILVYKLQNDSELLANSENACNCHGHDCGCGMNICHNPNKCSNDGCHSKNTNLYETN